MSGQLGNTDLVRSDCIGSGSGLCVIRDDDHANAFGEDRQQNISAPDRMASHDPANAPHHSHQRTAPRISQHRVDATLQIVARLRFHRALAKDEVSGAQDIAPARVVR